jgi:nitrate/TMAO reductase-like tetraheme cytochrome c subunit
MQTLRRYWRMLWTPTTRLSLGGSIIIGMVAGVVLWGSFNGAMALSNTEQFCTSCHEMRDNVFQESKEHIHYSNRSGVRAICSDCHVPKNWFGKVWRKIKASREIYHKIMGTIGTREKFEEHRLELAQRVWDTMKANDSRECRNCHDMSYMSPEKQKKRAWGRHQEAKETGETCIDCHKGIAHKDIQALLEKQEPEDEDLDFTL